MILLMICIYLKMIFGFPFSLFFSRMVVNYYAREAKKAF
jgi:hypothetical protein